MIKDRVALDLPDYDGLLAGHYGQGPCYGRRRDEGTDDWLLVATLSGWGRFGTAQGDLASAAGSLVLLSPGTPHDYGSKDEGWELLWVHFHPPHAWLDLLAWPCFSPGVAILVPSDWSAIEQSFREVVATAHRPRFGTNALERLLLLLHDELPSTASGMDERIEKALAYIQAHLDADLGIDRLSRLVHLSPSRFAHLFRAEIGIAPAQYIDLQRMCRAKTLLERTTFSVKEIAAEVGMEPFHLSTRFRAHTGLSPRTYREVGRSKGRPLGGR